MMKGDFSRLTFDPKKHYRRVLMQQGRVQVDADWNEQEAIHQHRADVEARDVIGRCGAPIHDAGFQITVNDKGELVIGKGRFYADGILCENDAEIGYLQQPDLPNPPKPADALKSAPVGIVYLDVWERHITALDDPRIREVALGGPDTATRGQTVWQVKILPVKPGMAGQPSCGSRFAEWDALTAPSDATLNARTQPPGTDSPCLIPPTAGYQRLENQLYRVEVHKGGALGAATFKWSRDNGSVVTAIEKLNGQEITVNDVGPDNVLGFANGQWVELVDDRIELLGQAGPLIQIDKVDAATRTVTLKSAPAGIDQTKRPKLRRWDSAGELKVEVPAGDGWIALEGGIQVHFAAGNYRMGDYWLIPARTATGEIEWPPFQVPNATPLPQPPAGVHHHYCRLALIQLGANGNLQVVEDCRPLFPPLTEIGTDPGVHVTAVNLNATKQLLHNDSDVTVIEFAQGIEIVCDAEVFSGSLQSKELDHPICTITLDLPYPFNVADRQLWGDNVIGFQPLVLAAKVNAAKNSIIWLPADATRSWLLQQLFSMLREFKRGDRLLARLTLKGNFVWAAADPKLYLDGEVFGFDRDKTTEVRFPSGNGRRGGDLEMWFWLVSPPPTPTLLKVKSVRILNSGGNLGNPNAPVLATMASPAQTLSVPAQLSPNTIEVGFTGPVDQASVVNGKSFLVVSAATGQVLNGQLLFIANDTVRWAPVPGTAPASLPAGPYRISLKGEGGAVITANGVALDGEPAALPSGNNVAGGDFTFSLTVTAAG
jgi:hypothetical protein